MDSLEDRLSLTLARVDFKSGCAHKGVIEERKINVVVFWRKKLHASPNPDIRGRLVIH